MNKGQMVRRITDGVAVGGVTLPAWFDQVQQASDVAAAALPLMSAAWLLFQIVTGVYRWKKGGRDGNAA